MAQLVVNPEELARFALNLREFTEHLRQNMHRLNGQFSQLRETWRDQEQQKFAQEYMDMMKSIERFLNTSDQHIPFLLRKAERAREYQHQK